MSEADSDFLEQLSEISTEIINQYWPRTSPLLRKPVRPEQTLRERVTAIEAVKDFGKNMIWSDTESSLYLDFWRESLFDAKFMLFYSSPERELANFFESTLFDIDVVNDVISAWIVRLQAMLAFYSNNNKECLLVNTTSVFKENNRFLACFNEFSKDSFTFVEDFAESVPKSGVLDEFLATAFLLNNDTVSEIYVELCSKTTVIAETDKIIVDIITRNSSLLKDSLEESRVSNNLLQANKTANQQLELTNIHLQKLQQELEFYYGEYQELTNLRDKMKLFMTENRLLRLVRLARVANS